MKSLRKTLVAAMLVLTACAGPDPAPATTATVPLTTLAAVATTAPTSAGPAPTVPPPPKAGVCRSYEDPIVGGSVNNQDVTETSGIVVSRTHSGTIWMHNDSGGGPIIYASNFAGDDLGSFELDASTFDWEDMAIGPGPQEGLDYLYVGDIGDNLHFRNSITVHRIIEPVPDPAGGIVDDVAAINLVYPDPGHDSEAMFVDPVTGDIIVITKPSGGDPAQIFRAPADELMDAAIIDLIPVGVFPLESGTFVTGADINTTGNVIVFRGYNEVWLWERIDLDFSETFATEPCRTPSTAEVQGEAIALYPDRFAYVTISEGSNPDINIVTSIFD